MASFVVGALLVSLARVDWDPKDPITWRARVLVTDARLPVVEVYIPEQARSYAICFPISEELTCYSARANVMRRGIRETDWELANVREMMLVDSYTLIYSRKDYADGELQVTPREEQQ